MFDIKIAISIFGIYFAYIVMSLFTEKMYSYEYPSIVENQPPQRFTFPVLHVWMGALFCTIFGMFRSKTMNQPANPIPIKERAILGILYTLNILGVNTALKYLPFHIELVGRNVRLLVVIIVGVFFTRVQGEFKHKLRKSKLYIGMIITIGAVIFSLLNESKHKHAKSEETFYGLSGQHFGYLILLVSVLADALFADSQAYEKSMYKPTANHLFVSANFATFLICLGYSIVNPNDNIVQHYEFLVNHPTAIKQLLIINGLQVLGQVSIYYVVANCSQHVFPLVSTTRRIVTFSLSVIFYGHVVKPIQLLAVIIIFAGIGIEMYDEQKHKQLELKQKKQKQKLLGDTKQQKKPVKAQGKSD